MAIRITQNQLASTFNRDVQNIYAKLAKSQQQLGDGRRITKPSDDPFGTSQVIGYDKQLADTQRFQANTKESIGFLNTADAAMDTVTSALQAIREKTIQAANTSTYSAQDLQAISTEILQYKEVIRGAMNSQVGDVYIFGGTGTTAAPYPAGSNAYAGSGNVMSRRVGPGESIDINTPGTNVLGPDGANTLDIIDQLAADIAAGNNPAIRQGIDDVTAQFDTALSARTQLGTRVTRLELIQTRLEMTQERLMSARTEIADVDATEAYLEFTQHQTMYQAALASGMRIMQTSILDFI
ncbi:MAG: flagellar hook-associated protein FlgL [Gaiellales bacterium]